MKRSIFIIAIVLLVVSCIKPTPRYPVTHHSTSMISESVKLNKTINSVEEKAILYYIAQDSLSNYLVSPDGFWYKYIHKISVEKKVPVINDRVLFEYEISDLSNTVIYSKQSLGQVSYSIDKEDITTGLQNGLKLMKEGEEVVFILPSYNAFGFTGDGNKIGVKQPLIYKVKLLKINQ